MDLTNNLKKIYCSLASSKGRKEHGLFIAQGTKCVEDTIGHFKLEALLATEQWIEGHSDYNATKVSVRDIERISTLSNAPSVIAVYHIPEWHLHERWKTNLVVALDCIQDPGNLGTIIRVCDWMGVNDILASCNTADVWNPKVIQATMGAISRVKVHYLDLPSILAEYTNPIYGTFLGGENIYKANLSTPAIVIMGNEGNGISEKVAAMVNRKLTIPPYPIDADTSESLNVAIATAITLSEFRKNG